ncbi:hypothetical protein CJO94_08015 [Ralstonia solanacearum]|nr:hypothetical protein CJO94_08015 [Ralstonia solanacearum]
MIVARYRGQYLNHSLFQFMNSRVSGIDVIDDFFSSEQLTELLDVVQWLPAYYINRQDHVKGAPKYDIHWTYPLVERDDMLEADREPELRALDETLHPIVDLWDRMKELLGASPMLYECMLTANPYGLEGRPHYDCPDPARRPNHVTVLVYCNREWDLAWGGETVVCDHENEIVRAVLPKPGRISILRGDPYHVARGVSRFCLVDRRVLTYKAWLR